MSYDLRVGVKVAGCEDLIVEIGRPTYDSPTYNLRDMFRACMDWDYEQGKWYKVSEVLPKVERGVHELAFEGKKYDKYNPENGWGSRQGALQCLESLLQCFAEFGPNSWEPIPFEHLYMRW